MKTKRDLLKILYWGQTEIAQMSGCSFPTAKKTLRKAQEICTSEGYGLPYENKVYNKYAMIALGLDFDYLEKIGALDTEIL